MNVPKTRPERHELPPGFACGVGLDDGSIANRLVVISDVISVDPEIAGSISELEEPVVIRRVG